MVHWKDDDHVIIGDTALLTLGPLENVDLGTLYKIGGMRSNSERLVMLKTRRLVQYYLDVLESLRPRRVLELGIYQGGSVALIAEAATPEALVAIDLASEPVAALEEWIEQWSGPSKIKTYYGLDQTDTTALARIVEDDFDGPLDLVIDDASHWMPESRDSFNALFPRLRPGGVYLVEDWSWAHTMDPTFLAERAPLTLLVFELVIACAHVPGLIEQVAIGPDAFIVRRGPADLDLDPFDISAYFDPRARDLVPTLGSQG